MLSQGYDDIRVLASPRRKLNWDSASKGLQKDTVPFSSKVGMSVLCIAEIRADGPGPLLVCAQPDIAGMVAVAAVPATAVLCRKFRRVIAE